MLVVLPLLDFLTDDIRLIYHEAEIAVVFTLAALLFRASSRAAGSDKLQKYIAFFFAALALDRVLLVGAVAFRLYQPWLIDTWIRIIHLGLTVMELSIVLMVIYLLGNPIKDRLRLFLKDWLDDDRPLA